MLICKDDGLHLVLQNLQTYIWVVNDEPTRGISANGDAAIYLGGLQRVGYPEPVEAVNSCHITCLTLIQ